MSDLAQRIQRLEDIEAIKQLKAAYLHSCDVKDIDGIRRCFADGEILINYGAIGQFSDRESFIALFQSMACNDHIHDMHHGQNPQIHWHNEDSASAIWDLYFYQVNNETQQLTQLAGSYHDKYVKQDGQWVITDTQFTVSSTVVSQITENGTQIIAAGNPPG